MKPSYNPFVSSVLALAASSTLHAQTWDGNGTPNAGGNWSTALNWSIDTVPTTGNTAVLDNSGANRTVIYDSAASGALGMLTFNQSSAFINTLSVQRALTITTALTLGATGGGTSQFAIAPSSAALTVAITGGLTINSGGLLTMGFGTSNSFNSTLSAVTTTSGGTLSVSAAPTTGSAPGVINSTLNMTSGAITLNSAAITDLRLQVNNNFTATGGAITSTNSGTLVLNGGINSISGSATLGSNISVSLGADANQTFSSSVTLNTLVLRGSAASITKTITSTASGNGIGQIQFINSASNGSTTLQLGSNLTLNAGAALPFAQNFSQGSGTVNFGINTNGFTLDLTSNASTYTPNIAVVGTLTNYNFSGSGRIKATNFDFRTASQVNVGAGTLLEATAASGTINFGGGGTIDPTSTIVYSGGAGVGAPVILATNRNLGNVQVDRGFVQVADTTLPFLSANSSSGLLLGGSASTNAANNSNANIGFAVRSATTGQNLTLARNLDFSQTPSTYSGRQRFTFDSSLTVDTSKLTVSGNVLLPATAGRDARQEFTVTRSGMTLDLTGVISGNNSSGFLINGGNSGIGSVRLSNSANSFGALITVTNGSLLVGGAVGATGNSALGTNASITLADGGTAASNFSTTGSNEPAFGQNGNPAFLIDGAFTVNRAVNLSNAATFSSGNGVPNSYVIGGNTAAASSLVGNVTVGSTAANKLLNLTQATGGTFTHSGVISPNADATGNLNVVINAQQGLSAGSTASNYKFSANAGTVVLTGNNTYDGTTTVAAGRLVIAGNHTGSGQVVVNNNSTLQFGDGTSTNGSVAGSGTIFVNTAGVVQLNKTNGGTLTNSVASNPSATITLGGINATGTTNTFSGTSFSNGGTLATNSSIAGAVLAFSGASGAIDLKGTNLTVGGAGDTLFTSAGQGIYSSTTASSVTKTGTGTLVYQGNQGYTGTTAIDTGAIRVDIAQTNSGNYFVGNGGTTGTAASLMLGGAGGTGGGVTFSNLIAINAGTANNRTLGGTNTTGTTNTFSGTTYSNGAGGLTVTSTSAGAILAFTNVQAIDVKDTSVLFNGAGITNVSGAVYNSTGSGSLNKQGAGTLTLSAANTYSGGTTVSAGTLLVNNLTGSGTGSNTVNVTGGALGGTGTISGATTIGSSGTLAPTAQTSGSKLTLAATSFTTGSIFEWSLNATNGSDPGVGVANSGAYGQVSAGSTTGTAVFAIVLGSNTYADAFWNTDKVWNNIYTATGLSDLSSVFTSFSGAGLTTSGSGVTATATASGRGSFTFNGSSTLTWSAVPEPTTALAGLLLGAGLLRRRRGCALGPK